MNHSDWSYAWAAIVIAFIVLRAVIGLIRRAAKADRGGDGMARIDAAAKRILEDRAKRGSVPVTQDKSAIGTATKAKPRPVRNAAMAQKPGSAVAALAKTRSPAVVRTGLSGAKEPVIQRRR